MKKSASRAKGPSQRQLRVGELVRHALSSILQRDEISDPVLDGSVISITEVAMSPDLKIATVYLSPLGAKDPKAIIDALEGNRKLIRGRAAPALSQMKYMPEFRFRADTSFENYAHIDSLLHSPEVARDLDSEEKE